MSKKKNFGGFMPMFPGMMPPLPPMPPMPFMPNTDSGWFGMKNNGNNEFGAKMDGWTTNMFSFWDQMIDMQKSSIDGNKSQWEQFFAHMMEMQESFADSLPDELPNLPGMPAAVKKVSPKAVVKKMKEFEELANEHAMEQADTANDFFIQGQEKARDLAKEAKESLDNAAAAQEEQPAEEQQQ